jgi:hypothetical protein
MKKTTGVPIWQKEPFTPHEVVAANVGARRSIQRILSLVDTTDYAWPRIAGALREFTEAGIELDEATVPLAIKLGKFRQQKDDSIELELFSPPETLAASGSIVYYLRRGSLIKIGTTADPHSRFRDLLPDEILAFEPGARPEESARHRQFWHLRESGEYFSDAPDLREHIDRTRLAYGAPDPSWPTVASLYEDAPRRARRHL